MVKILSRIFYRFETTWLSGDEKDLKNVKLLLFLNHTSLFEPLFLGVIPYNYIWRLAKFSVVPGADITLNRPIVGRAYKILFPQIATITRKRDDTWFDFLHSIHPESIIVMAPEGRMMRRSGLDKDGNPMKVRGGVSDILEKLDGGKILIAYSGGLHHVQAPGEKTIHIFRKLRVNLEILDINLYKAEMKKSEGKDFKHKVMNDLNNRKDKHIPQHKSSKSN